MTSLPKHLRQWGLKVSLHPRWQENKRPYGFYPRAILCHHTASGSSSGNFGSEYTVVNGRPPSLPGPLCQFLLGRNGEVKIISNGYANHAGYGGPAAGMPENAGNSYSWGIEAENNGLGEPWSREQMNAYYRLCAALMDYSNIKDVSRVIGHKEWAPGRKPDPAGIDMNKFRYNVRKALEAGPSVKTVSLKKLQPGKRNEHVVLVKRRLKRRGLFEQKKLTNFFGQELRDSYSAWQRHLGYTGKEANGIPGKTSLEKLGFRVVP